jgi:nicotinamide/nicotinate riboside kinase
LLRYVDKVVWPNYVKDHAFLFKDGNVEGEPKQDLLNQLNINAMPSEAQGDMTALLKWAYSVLEGALEPNNQQ